MRLVELPASKTYEAANRCIYCGDDAVPLTREHIMPFSLGGELIFPKASCTPCAKEIQKYEGDCLNWTFLQARTFLKLPMYDPARRKTDLRLGAFRGDERFPDLTDNFRFESVPVDQHPAAVIVPKFGLPGILCQKTPVETFEVTGLNSVHLNGAPPSHIGVQGERAGNFIRFSPDRLCQFIAKMAHSAATVELGQDAFDPMLPKLIRNLSGYASHLVGSPMRNRWPKTTSLHRIWLDLDGGYVVAYVQLFSRYGLMPYVAVVGTPRESLGYRHWRVR